MAFTSGHLLVFVSITVASAYLVVHEPRDDLCLVTGAQCSTNCESIILCPSQYGEPMQIVTCAEHSYCTAESGMPSCNATSCTNAIFRCTTPGAVPNPTNSSTYYLCPGIGTKGLLQVCAEGHFNTTTLKCTTDTEAWEIATCEKSSDTGKVGGEEFCYICDDQLIPVVYRCALDIHEYFYESLNQLAFIP